MPVWCDMMCPHADWPKEDALDGSNSCRTFIAVQCTKFNKITAKNGPCLDRTQPTTPKKKTTRKKIK